MIYSKRLLSFGMTTKWKIINPETKDELRGVYNLNQRVFHLMLDIIEEEGGK